MDWVEDIPSAWRGHRAFAESLVQRFGARSAVELGVDRGYSLFCFALAGIEKIYGVDLWEPQVTMPQWGYGDYMPVLARTAEQRGLSDRIQLVRGKFEDVVKDWPHGKVDVLHIDGTHEYEHVKQDFESWLPLVNDSGIVLLHDVCVPEFSVKEYFNEISLPKAWFSHSAGLGVVCRSSERLREIQRAFPNLVMGDI